MFSILLLFFLSISCGKSGSGSQSSEALVTYEKSRDPIDYVELVTPDGSTIYSSIASTFAEQTQGLQFVKDTDFAYYDGKLFFYLSDSTRTFWMPNTSFDLDIIYLDQNMKVVAIVEDLPHYTGNVSSEIPRAPAINSRHVLEMKSSSPISSGLHVGDVLEWKSPLSLQETESKIRQEQ